MKCLTLSVIAIAILLFAAIPAASAFTAALISPTNINNVHNGDTVTIRITGIANGNTFTTQLISTDLAPTGTTLSFSNFNMPFGFTAGTASTTLTTTGITGGTTLSVTDATGLTKTQNSVGNTISSTKDITAQTYQTISISGTPSGSTVGIDYKVGGTSVTGAVTPATLSFALNGVNTGNLRIVVNDGAVDRLDTTLMIVPLPGPVVNYDVGSSGGGAAPSGPAAPGAPAAPAAPAGQQQATLLIAPEGQTLVTTSVSTPTDATVDATVTVEQGTTITDPAGNFVNTISIEQVSRQDVPSMPEGAAFSFAGTAVNCGPEGVTFSEPATLTFSLTEAQWDLAMAQANGNPALMEVQYYDKGTQSWVGVPTTVNLATHEVTALVDHFSLFALVIIQAPPATPAVEITAAGVSPGLTRQPTTLLAKPPVTTPKPTPAPFVSVPAMIGVLVVAGLAYTLSRKR